jgi:hypothetical protein
MPSGYEVTDSCIFHTVTSTYFGSAFTGFAAVFGADAHDAESASTIIEENTIAGHCFILSSRKFGMLH